MSKLKVDGILQLQEIMLDANDAFFICKDDDLQEELRKRIVQSTLDDCTPIKDFIKENKENINVGKLVLAVYIRYQQYLDIINEAMSGDIDRMDRLSLERQKEILKTCIKNLKSIYKRMSEEYITYVNYKKEYELTIFNSDELIKDNNKEKNKEKFNKLNKKYFEKYGIENIFKYVALGDVKQFFSNSGLGSGVMLVTEANVASKLSNENMGQYKTANELHEKAKEIVYANKEKDDIIENTVKKEMYKYSKYIDIDRMLLIVAYRIKERLENGEKKDIESYKKLLTDLYNDIDKNTLVYYVSEYDTEDVKKEIVKFSSRGLKNTLNKFIDGEYINDETIENERKKVVDGTINVNAVNPQIVKLMELSGYEIEQIMDYSVDNFMYGVTALDYDLNSVLDKLDSSNNLSKNDIIKKLYDAQRISVHDIINLYENKKIEKSFFSQYGNDIDFSEDINIEKINEKYREIKSKKKASEKDEKELDTIIDLYKLINIDGKNEEEKDKLSDEIMYEIFEDEDEIQFYFEKGLITLNVLAEWTGEEFIEKLFEENKIDINTSNIERLKGKVSEEFLESLIIKSNPDIDTMLEYMKKGYISEGNIIKLFEEKDIYGKEAEELLNLEIISDETFETIRNRDLQKISDRVGNPIDIDEGLRDGQEIDEIVIPRKISHDLDSPLLYNENAQEDEFIDYEINIPKVTKKSDIRAKNHTKDKESSGGGKTQKLINPLVRYEFLKALKRKIPRSINYEDMGDKNPFYNYNFYILKTNNSENEITRDDVIIAERFYTDRENKTDFALDNATYIMRFEDYLILTGKQKENEINSKRSAIKEVPGAVYVVNHRDGTWAKNMLRAITQVYFLQRLNSISSRNTREKIIKCLEDLYDEEEILEILNLAVEIDRGEYTYVEENGKFVKLNKESDQNQVKPVGNSTDDDTDGR